MRKAFIALISMSLLPITALAKPSSIEDIRAIIEAKKERKLKYVARPVLSTRDTGKLKGQTKGLRPEPEMKAVPVPANEVSDLRAFDTSVKNQGQEGLCTAFATVASMEFHGKLQGRTENLSEKHLWSNYQQYYTVKALAAAKAYWTTKETIWPYGSAKPVATITPRGHMLSYVEAKSMAEVKAALRAKTPVVLSAETNTSWSNPYKGVLSVNGTKQGGHAILISGFFTTSRGDYFIVKNSWGTRYGDAGYVYLPEAYCAKFWCSFHLVKGAEFKN